jgi:glutamate N-acetyltransferase/amino-acid N-acetyltransferase
MKLTKGGITAASGFWASGVYCGIKFRNKDLALIYSKVPCVACGVFTQNKVQAAPVKVTQKHLKDNKAQAVIINSGNANCCTGAGGIRDAQAMAKLVAKVTGIAQRDVLVASTGKIGKRLAVDKIKNKMKSLIDSLSTNGSREAAQAILTTDTHPKEVAVQLKIGKKLVSIGGIAKGAGMISPNLATMLGFITTDAAIDKRRLTSALKEAVNNSFNLITVEGDTSTNDMVLALANGLSRNSKLSTKEFALFQEALNFVCLTLAKMIVKDAEGATKFVEIEVEGAKDVAQAKKIAFKVANSPLVKTAIYGGNPNWGRIAASAGAADTVIRDSTLDIYLGSVKVMQKGAALKTDQKKLNGIFKRKEIQIRIGLGLGKAKVKIYTCDLSRKYIDINAEY